MSNTQTNLVANEIWVRDYTQTYLPVRFYILRKIRLNKYNPEHNVILFFTSLIFVLSIYLAFSFGGVIVGIARDPKNHLMMFWPQTHTADGCYLH